jgi:hypothetical protein
MLPTNAMEQKHIVLCPIVLVAIVHHTIIYSQELKAVISSATSCNFVSYLLLGAAM